MSKRKLPTLRILPSIDPVTIDTSRKSWSVDRAARIHSTLKQPNNSIQFQLAIPIKSRHEKLIPIASRRNFSNVHPDFVQKHMDLPSPSFTKYHFSDKSRHFGSLVSSILTPDRNNPVKHKRIFEDYLNGHGWNYPKDNSDTTRKIIFSRLRPSYN